MKKLFLVLFVLIFGVNTQADGVSKVEVFQKGEKYGYRIPAVVVSKKGTVLAFAERRHGLHDHAQNDIVLRRSSDNGKTWGEEQILHAIYPRPGIQCVSAPKSSKADLA